MEVFTLVGNIAINRAQAEKDLHAVGETAEAATGRMRGSFDRLNTFLKGTLIGGIAAIGAAFVGMAKTGLDNMKEIHNSMHQFRVDTGASAEEAERFADTIRALHKVNTDSYEDLAKNVTAMRQRFGDLGDDMQDQTQLIMDFAKVTGTDAVTEIEKAHGITRVWNLELNDMPEIFDMVTKASQETGVSAGAVTRLLESQGEQWRAAGFSIEETIGFMAMAEAEGSNVQRAMNSMNRAVRLSGELSDTQAEALMRLGVELQTYVMATDERVEALRAEGIEVERGTRLTSSQLQVLRDLGKEYDVSYELAGSVEMAVKQMADAMGDGADEMEVLMAAQDVFGRRRGPEMVKILREIGESGGDMADVIADSAGTVSEASEIYDRDLGERWTLIKRAHLEPFMETLGTVLLNVLTKVLDLVEEWGPKVGAVFESLSNVVETVVGFVTSFVSDVFGGMAEDTEGSMSSMFETVQGVLGRLQEIVELIGGAMAVFWEQHGETIVAALSAAFDTLVANLEAVFELAKTVIENALQIIEGVLDIFIGLFTGDWERLKDGLLAVWDALWDTVGSVLSTAIQMIDNIFQGLPSQLAEWVEQAAESVKTWFVVMRDRSIERAQALFDGVVGFFKNLPQALGDAVKEAAESVKTWFVALRDRNIERVKEMWNGIVGAFSGKRIVEAVKGAFNSAVQYVTKDLPKQFLDGAKGLLDAFVDGVIDGARRIPVLGNMIADNLAKYLRGESPPPEGPLSDIDKGGTRIIEAWAGGLLKGIPIVDKVGRKLGDQLDLTLTREITAAVGVTVDAAKQQENIWTRLGKTVSEQWKKSMDNIRDSAGKFVESLAATFSPMNLLAQIMDKLGFASAIVEGMFSALEPVIEALREPLRIVGFVIGTVLAPILKMLSPILTGFGIIVSYVAEIIGSVWNALAGAINWALGWLGVNIPTVDIGAIREGRRQLTEGAGGGDDPDPRDADDPSTLPPGSGAPPSSVDGPIVEFTGEAQELLERLLEPLEQMEEQTGLLRQIHYVLEAMFYGVLESLFPLVSQGFGFYSGDGVGPEGTVAMPLAAFGYTTGPSFDGGGGSGGGSSSGVGSDVRTLNQNAPLLYIQNLHVRDESDIQRLSEQIENLNRHTLRAMGVS